MRQWNALLKRKNVHYWDAMLEPSTAQHILSLFTAGLIPYDIRDSFTYTSHPMKTYDYLGSGLPVISSPLPSLVQYEKTGFVHIAHTPEQFVQYVKKLSRSKKHPSPTELTHMKRLIRSQSMQLKMKQLENIFCEYEI